MDYLKSTCVYLHGRDADGKLILMFKSKLHIRGSKNQEDLKRCMVYWIERGFRESNNDHLTLVFDMLDSGLSNIDMEYTRTVINIFKYYYPDSLNWILVYEMPWIMNGECELLRLRKAFFISIASSYVSNHQKASAKESR